MMENALASCISCARSHRVKSGVCAEYCLFTGVGEWVVSSENGTKSKVEIHEGVNDQNDKLRVLGRASWGDPPRVKDPNVIHG